jgi:sugar lactone lactonase YvrE
MRVVAVAAVIGAAALAYSLPRVRAQNSSTSGAATASHTPVVIAQGISARALALGVAANSAAADSAAANGEASQLPPIYFTAVQMPNRVMSLGAAVSSKLNANVASGASANGSFVAIAGDGMAGSLGDGGAGPAAQLNLKFDSPYMRSGVAVAADGTIFIADTKNATIRRISSASSTEPGVIRSVAGKWGPTQNVKLSGPLGLALDRAGNLYIADHGANAVIELHDATASNPGKMEVLAHVAQAAGVSVADDGSRVFIAATEIGTVLRLDAATHGLTTLVASSGTACRAPTETAAGGAPPGVAAVAGRAPMGTTVDGAQSLCPDGIALDGGGNIFIADSAGSRLLRIDAATQKLTTGAGNISIPGEIAFDADGNLFVAEEGRNRIVEIKGLGQPVASVTLTPPPAPVPPMGVPCPAIAPPPAFASNTNFCSEPLAGTTPTSAFTLTNNSNAAISGIAISTIGLAPADFVVSSTSCTTTLNAGASCLINLAFAPTAAAPRTATLVVNYTGATTPLASSVAGTGDDYQITLASGQLEEISINAGDTGTYMLQVVPDNTFTGTVTLICPGNLPMETTCTFSPASVDVTTPGTAVPFSVAFQTTSRTPVKKGVAPTLAPANRANSPGTPGVNSSGAIVAFMMVVAAFGLARRKRIALLAPVACVLALVLGVAAVLVGCKSYKNQGPTGTPAGIYKMTVQATAQAAPRGITVTLDVE